MIFTQKFEFFNVVAVIIRNITSIFANIFDKHINKFKQWFKKAKDLKKILSKIQKT